MPGYPSFRRGRQPHRGQRRGTGRPGQSRPPTATQSAPDLQNFFATLVSAMSSFLGVNPGASGDSGTGVAPTYQNQGYPPPLLQNMPTGNDVTANYGTGNRDAPRAPRQWSSVAQSAPRAPSNTGGTRRRAPQAPRAPSNVRVNQAQDAPEPRVHSENPDFRSLVRATNLGARLNSAKQNWEHLPVTVNSAIDRITSSIRPPAPTDSLKHKLGRAADQFKNAIRHTVTEHLVAQYASNQRNLAQLDGTDKQEAYQIARKQLIRSNGRITGTRADELLAITKADEECYRQDMEWRIVPNRKRPASRSPPAEVQPEEPLPVSNRFQGLQDELDIEGLQDLLDQSISDPNQTAAAKEPPP